MNPKIVQATDIAKLILLMCFISIEGKAQSEGIYYQAQILDSLRGEVISGVNISIIDSKGIILRKAVSANNGLFRIKVDTSSISYIQLSCVGYISKRIEVEQERLANEKTIYLIQSVSIINEIKVVANRSNIQFIDDKIIYDVSRDSLAKEITGLEMMSRVPLLDVTPDNKLLLKGGSDYKVVINGKLNSAASVNPASFLRNMPASSIASIEVLVDPPLRYKQEGVNYVINIITVKNSWDNYFGSINSQININRGYSIGGSFNTKINKLGIVLNLDYSTDSVPASKYFYRGTNNFPSRMIANSQSGNRLTRNEYFNGDFQASYDLNQNDLINFSLTTSIPKTTLLFNVDTYINNLSADELLFTRNSQSVNTTGFALAGLDYEKRWKDSKRTLTLSGKWFKTINQSDNTIILSYPSALYESTTINNLIHGQSNEYTSQVDFVAPLPKNAGSVFEIGGKYISRTLVSNSGLDDLRALDYKQGIASVYSSFNFSVKKILLKIGAEANNTTDKIAVSNSNLLASESLRNRSYISFLPRLSVFKTLKSNRTISAIYNLRVRRPGISYLNPLVNVTNPLFQQTGNPLLDPEYMQSFTLSYNTNVFKSPLAFSIYYRSVGNAIDQLRTTRSDSIILLSYANIGHSDLIGFTAYYSKSLFKNFTLRFNSDVGYYYLRNLTSNQDNNNLNYKLFITLTYRFPKKTTLSLYNFLYSRAITFQGYTSRTSDVQLVLSKAELFHKQINGRLLISQPFRNTFAINSFYEDPSFRQEMSTITPVRFVSLNLIFNFGDSNKSLFSAKKRSINNDDAK